MPSHSHSAWIRLGELLMRRRNELDPRYSNRRLFVDERAPGRYRIVNAIEKGQRTNYEAGTLTALEVAYDLPAGHIQRILDGAQLVELADAPGWSDDGGSMAELRSIPGHDSYVKALLTERQLGMPLRSALEEKLWTLPWDEATRVDLIAGVRLTQDQARAGRTTGLASGASVQEAPRLPGHS